jgi:ribonucleoside-diphosphate reductase alpha chain
MKICGLKAMMATMDVRHPDIVEYIKAKREDGRLRQFNMSVLITDYFMDAVKEDREWQLLFPVNKTDDITAKDKVVYTNWHVDNIDDYHTTEEYPNKVMCKIYKIMKARELWQIIMQSTYDYAEPGFILVDRINKMNNLYWDEHVDKTNPCGN